MEVKQISLITVRTRTDSKISFVNEIMPRCMSHLEINYGIAKGSHLGGFFVTSRNRNISDISKKFRDKAHFVINSSLSIIVFPSHRTHLLKEIESSLNYEGLQIFERWESKDGQALCFFDKDVEQAKNCITAVLGIQDS